LQAFDVAGGEELQVGVAVGDGPPALAAFDPEWELAVAAQRQ
jgi:hypothetical protein